MDRGHRTMNICVRCSNIRSCSANIRTRDHGLEKKLKNIRTLNIQILANIRTFEYKRTSEQSNISEHSNIEHSNISEHPKFQIPISKCSNIEHFNVQKMANIVQHSNTNVRHLVAPDHNSESKSLTMKYSVYET